MEPVGGSRNRSYGLLGVLVSALDSDSEFEIQAKSPFPLSCIDRLVNNKIQWRIVRSL